MFRIEDLIKNSDCAHGDKYHIFFGRQEYAEYLTPHEDVALISIGSVPDIGCRGDDWHRTCRDKWKDHYFLRLEFIDLCPESAMAHHKVFLENYSKDVDKDEEDFEKWYSRQVFFSEEMADQIIDFLQNMPENIRLIFVNCEAGVSRSAAVAKWIGEKFDIPVNTCNYYNKHVYRVLSERYKIRSLIL